MSTVGIPLLYCSTFNSVIHYPIYLYISVLPILGLDITINDLAHPKFEDSKPFIFGELEFRQLVISYEAIEM